MRRGQLKGREARPALRGPESREPKSPALSRLHLVHRPTLCPEGPLCSWTGPAMRLGAVCRSSSQPERQAAPSSNMDEPHRRHTEPRKADAKRTPPIPLHEALEQATLRVVGEIRTVSIPPGAGHWRGVKEGLSGTMEIAPLPTGHPPRPSIRTQNHI